MDERSEHRRSVPVWAVVLLLIVASGTGGLLSYSVLGREQPMVASPTTVTQTSAITSFTSHQTSASSPSSGIDAVLLYKDASQSVVTVDGFVTSSVLTLLGPQNVIQEVLGSGFVVARGGTDYVVTNDHVVDSAMNITVTFRNGDAFPASVVGTDPYSDLAVLTVSSAPSTELHPLTLSSSSSLRVGQPVVAIGNPFGLSGSMTVGIVSQLGRTVNESLAGSFSIADVIQFSAPINPGNSGGPLLAADGTVVGITTATISGSQGVGFAIPSDAIIREIGPLISTGSYNMHPYLGITGADMDYALSLVAGTKVTYGVLVESVAPGGPAANAGLRAGSTQATIAGQGYLIGGDIIISINGTRIVSNEGLASFLEEHAAPGTVLDTGIIRSGEMVIIHILVGVRPPPP